MGFIFEIIAVIVKWILPLVGAVAVGDWVVHKSGGSTSGSGSGSTNGTNLLGTIRFVAIAAILVGGFALAREMTRAEEDFV